MEPFIVRTSIANKKKFDIQIAKFIYATNSAFRHVEHPEFIKLINLLHPGYKPPLRRQIANELLNEVFDSELVKIKDCLNGKSVCMAQDGWSNIHNDSIVCISATDIIDETVHLCDTIDTKDNSHTAEYLLNLVVTSIKSCQKHGCRVRSFVTDNAANMRKMREQLAKCEELGMPDIITYGCSAHILNLLAHDIEIPGIKENIKKIMKYFRNTHFAAAKYKEAGGKALVMPQDVRWNTLADCLESYISNWHILSKVCTDNRVVISSDISSKVNDMNLKIKAMDYLEKLKVISVALDKIQRDCCTISEATEIWIEIINHFKLQQNNFVESDLHCVLQRFKMAMTPAHYLANLLDHRFRGLQLSQEQLDEAMEYVNSYHPAAMPDVMSYRAKTSPFKNYFFSEESIKNVKPITWWLALKINVNTVTFDLVTQLHTAIASSAGIERLFSASGLVHTKLRNRLGVEKASKLVTIMKALNKKGEIHQTEHETELTESV